MRKYLFTTSALYYYSIVTVLSYRQVKSLLCLCVYCMRCKWSNNRQVKRKKVGHICHIIKRLRPDLMVRTVILWHLTFNISKPPRLGFYLIYLWITFLDKIYPTRLHPSKKKQNAKLLWSKYTTLEVTFKTYFLSILLTETVCRIPSLDAFLATKVTTLPALLWHEKSKARRPPERETE